MKLYHYCDDQVASSRVKTAKMEISNTSDQTMFTANQLFSNKLKHVAKTLTRRLVVLPRSQYTLDALDKPKVCSPKNL